MSSNVASDASGVAGSFGCLDRGLDLGHDGYLIHHVWKEIDAVLPSEERRQRFPAFSYSLRIWVRRLGRSMT
jgi:hypothetical protein